METTMYSKKTLVAAAALVVLAAAGIGSATAEPWNHDADHRIDQRMDNRGLDHRGFDRHPGAMHRHYVDRFRVESALRFHHYRLIGDPFFVRGHYVVRTHDRFGRIVVVEVDPFSGAYLGLFRI
jgi:hypothetical protein